MARQGGYMDLRSGRAFWPIKNGLLQSYPALQENLSCDVAIIGGGITGALVAYHLAKAGLDTVIIERRDVAAGSTSASTALLQYEVDTHLSDLIEMVGRERAVRSYLLCLEAILRTEQLVQQLDDDCGFERKKSLYIASDKRDVKSMQAEYEERRKIGIALEMLDEREIKSRFSFGAPLALLSQHAAQVDPFRMAHALLRAAAAKGVKIYDRTQVVKHEYSHGGVTLQTDRKATVSAKHMVVAAGYESGAFLDRSLVSLRSSYALVTEPVDSFPGWGEDQCLIWESARPYLYTRTTSDGRILIGGEDDPFDNEIARDKRVDKKAERLLKRAASLFPEIQFERGYAWAGTFGETKDGLAYIGQVPEFPNTHFALGYGGNGITYSVIAAELIRDAITGQPNPDADVFSFER